MTPERHAVLDALADLPDDVWTAYLHVLRGINIVIGEMMLEDPTVPTAVEEAIAKNLGEA